jgi:serine/threonine protein kinase
MNAIEPRAERAARQDPATGVSLRIQSILGAEGGAADAHLAGLCAKALDRLLERQEIALAPMLAMLQRCLAVMPHLPAGAHHTTADIPARLSDRFVILDHLGSGGRSAVFKALDLVRLEAGETDRYVAVKLATTGSPDTVRQLFTEWRHAQAVAHPNILGIHDVVRAGEHVFAVQAYMPGQSLKAILREAAGRPLARRRMVVIIQQIAAALARFHACHRIHGDLKPSNIICRADGLTRVIDLSSVRLIPHIEAGRWRGDSDAGPVELTPAYASPQRLAGDDPDPSDDVFSFAVTICEMLGQHPFGGLAVNLPPDLSRAARRALTRALAPRRKDRWPSVEAFIAALRLPD